MARITQRMAWVLCAVLFALGVLAAVWAYATQRISLPLLSASGALLVLLFGFVGFELRRPDAKTLSSIAVLSAVGVAGRVLFAPLANFKPLGAVVIVAGAVYGPFAGFVTGAVSTLCSNMLFGQGAWTPWQMLGFGLVGAGAGILGKQGFLQRRTAICVYGAFSGFAYGVVVDSFYLLGYVAPTREAIWTAVAGGLLFSTIHAAANVFFLALFGRAWIKKLARIRDK